MQDWSRPDPLTRDLIHLINARRHDHWDVDVALDTLTELIEQGREEEILTDRKSTRLNSSHVAISYAVFCLKKKRQRADVAGPLPNSLARMGAGLSTQPRFHRATARRA